MNFLFVVFIKDKLWHRYTRRPHFSALSKFGKLIVIESPFAIFSKETLSSPIKSLKNYFKYSFGERKDQRCGAIVLRPVILFPERIRKYSFFKDIDQKLVSLFLLKYKLKYKLRGCIVINFLTGVNFEWIMPRETDKEKYILVMNDEWSMIGYDDSKRYVIEQDTKDLVGTVDLVFAVTIQLKKKYSMRGNVYYLPNCVDTTHYKPAFDITTMRVLESPLKYDLSFLNLGKNDPREYLMSLDVLKKMDKPIVGSISGLSGNWSDFEFMAEVERLFPQNYSLVSSGNIFAPSQTQFMAGYQSYTKKQRMVFLGHLDYSVLPDFLESIDVSIVMHRMDEFNTHSAPNKIWAYLAMGLPVVSTDFLNDADKEVFEGMVKFAKNPEEYVNAIVQSIEADNLDLKIKRRNLALKNSTERRAEELVTVIRQSLLT